MGLKETINALPHTPGVYIMRNDEGVVLYVGKANDLKKRVSSYFQASRKFPGRIRSLVSQIKDISHISTSTSAEALIYENGLIKRLCPKYNIALRDDKSYPMFELTVDEKFPRLMITREKKNSLASYYGPYANAKLLKEALRILRKLFPLRTCDKIPKRRCLQFDIGQCLGPCEGRVSEERYGAIVRELRLFLEGRPPELMKLLTDRMKELSKDERFEEASEYRNRLEALGSVNTDRVKYGPVNELGELKSILGIKGKLSVIEAFDVSDIMGDEAVGSLVYFRKGKPDKNEYRKFKIKTVLGMDDYSMMREIVRRRYKRLLDEKKVLPDLIIVDGGRGHLGVALGELKRLGIDNIPIIGIAKPRTSRRPVSERRELYRAPPVRGGEFERIYVKDKKDPIILPKESKALHLLERVRDEAHRFAVSYHKKLMSKRITKGV